MQVNFEIPEDVARAFVAQQRPIDRAALEALAAEGYRSGVLTESHLRRLLDLPSRFAVHDWLREHKIPYLYTQDDLAADLTTLSELGLR